MTILLKFKRKPKTKKLSAERSFTPAQKSNKKIVATFK